MIKALISDKQPVAAKNQLVESAPLTEADVRKNVREIVEAILREHNPPTAREIIGFDQLVTRLPLSPRSISAGIKDGWIPAIRLPGGRKLLFDWDVVRAALRRFETGGPQ